MAKKTEKCVNGIQMPTYINGFIITGTFKPVWFQIQELVLGATILDILS
jgi:hypothetical protein